MNFKYLITTGAPFEKREDSSECLFTGDWCYIKGEKWSNQKRTQTIDYPFQYHHEIEKAQSIIQPAYHHFIKSFIKLFKNHHNKEADSLYYEKLLGAWLIYFLNNCYEKYRILKIAQKTATHLKVKVSNNVVSPCKDYLEYALLSQESDTFNFHQYSKLLENLPHFQLEKVTLPSNSTQHKPHNSFKTTLVKSFRHLLYQTLRIASFNRHFKTLIVDPYYEKVPFRSIQILLGSHGRILHDIDTLRTSFKTTATINYQSRSQASLDILTEKHPEPFINIVSKMIMDFLPICYWEGFQDLTQQASIWGKKNSAIKQLFTCNAHMYNTFFSAISAENSNIQLSISQHGGSYGYAKVFHTEWYEKRVADRYFTWGWGEEILPHPKLLKKQVEKTSKLLLTFPSPAYYGSFLDNFFSSSNVLKSYQETQIFIDSLPLKIQQNIFIRERPHSFVRKYQDHQVDQEKSFDKSLMESQLHITNHLSTPFLESMSANIPTIAFYDPQVQTFRKEAILDFKKLEEAKILFKSSKDAAQHLKETFKDIESWWHSEDLQKTRLFFCQKYAISSHNWRKNIIESLSKCNI